MNYKKVNDLLHSVPSFQKQKPSFSEKKRLHIKYQLKFSYQVTTLKRLLYNYSANVLRNFKQRSRNKKQLLIYQSKALIVPVVFKAD